MIGRTNLYFEGIIRGKPEECFLEVMNSRKEKQFLN